MVLKLARAALIVLTVFLLQLVVRFEIALYSTPPGGTFRVGWLPGM